MNQPTIDMFTNTDRVGFVELINFQTRVPLGIRRKVYKIKSIATEAWDISNQTAVQVPLSNVFAGNSFESSAFGNRQGYLNGNIAIKCEIWFRNWPININYSTIGGNCPPVNLQFAGSCRIASSLAGLLSPTASINSANPYDEDAAKIGIISILLPELPNMAAFEGNNLFSFWLSRDRTYMNTLRATQIVTLN
jgi:hypothetical protein